MAASACRSAWRSMALVRSLALGNGPHLAASIAYKMPLESPEALVLG